VIEGAPDMQSDPLGDPELPFGACDKFPHSFKGALTRAKPAGRPQQT
jgi:hypothetical protein